MLLLIDYQSKLNLYSTLLKVNSTSECELSRQKKFSLGYYSGPGKLENHVPKFEVLMHK